jgi:hypothetical protein
MRKIQAPPLISQSWDFPELLAELEAKGKYLIVSSPTVTSPIRKMRALSGPPMMWAS